MTTDEAVNLAKACVHSLHIPPHLAEDAIQEAVMAWLTAPEWNGSGSERGYTYQRMKWAVASFYRSDFRKNGQTFGFLPTQPWEAPEESWELAREPDIAERFELVDAINGALRTMTPRDQEVVAMAMYGYPYASISNRCRTIGAGLNGKGIKSVLARFKAIMEGIDEHQAYADQPVQ